MFVDHFSDLSYVHVQKGATGAETVEAKKAFERYCKSFGVQISHYHADNGVFADKLFRQECDINNQDLTFCGVYAHHQNGKAERRIRELQDTA